MKRIQYIEIEDLTWFPAFLRNPMTDFLQFVANKMNVYQAIIPMLSDLVHKQGSNQIVDIASGGGGGLLRIVEELEKSTPSLEVTLTDFYPNIPAFKRTQAQNKRFKFYEKSVDARNVPSELKGLRSMFLSFHHFNPNDAKEILSNAVKSNQPIAIFEIQDRSLPSLIAMLFSPISTLVFTPFIRPFSLSRLVFTYLIPILPLLILHDGIVSSLRTYSPAEMDELILQVPNHTNFDWKTEKIKGKSGFVIYLTGIPK